MHDHHYAVVVGINRYPGLSDLAGARADAEAFAQWLEKPDGGGLPAANVKRVMATDQEEATFGDPAGAKPVREQIEDALADAALAARAAVQADPEVWERTRLLVRRRARACTGRRRGCSVPRECTRGCEPPPRARRISQVVTRCAHFREVIVFADCCRTRVSTIRALPPTLDECPDPLENRQTTWIVGFGSGLGDVTYEDDARGHFTSALIEGLTNAKPDETGAVTAAALAPYVKTAVADRTKSKRYPQKAELYGDFSARVVFRTQPPPARATRQVTISFPQGYTGLVELRRGVQPVGSHDASTGPWSLPLDEGLYEVTPAAGQPPTTFVDNGLFKVVERDRDVQL